MLHLQMIELWQAAKLDHMWIDSHATTPAAAQYQSGQQAAGRYFLCH
jgi:hypothetical protein